MILVKKSRTNATEHDTVTDISNSADYCELDETRMTEMLKITKQDPNCRTSISQPTQMRENSGIVEIEVTAIKNDEISHGTYPTFVEEAEELKEVEECNIDIEEKDDSLENNYTVLDEFKKTERVVSLGVYSNLKKSGKEQNIELASE